MATRGALVRCGVRISKLFSASASPSSSSLSSAASSNSKFKATREGADAAGPIGAGVEVQDFLRVIGQGVEEHAEKMANEPGSLPNFLRFRDGSLKGLDIPCQQRGTALASRKYGCIEDVLRKEEYRTLFLHRIHSFCKDSFTSAGSRLHLLEDKGYSLILPYSVRGINTQTALLARQRSVNDEESQRDLTRQEDPFDSITDKIPEKPVSVAEGASYSVVILVGLAIAGAAAYAVFKELVFEPKEYKVFGKALNRVQNDNQVSVRLGSPITGYGQESRNRAARQRISNRAWTDEAGIERIEVMFHIRGPAGAGKVYSEMFKDPEDKTWKYTYLIVDVISPSPTRLMLESYVPPLAPLNTV